MGHRRKTGPGSAGGKPYAVGYGKPPEHSRFKKGRSGCPGGRGRKTPPVPAPSTILYDILAAQRMIVVDGKRNKVSSLSIVLTRLVHGAVQGDPRMTRMLLSLIEQWPMPFEAPVDDGDRIDYMAALREKLSKLAERMAQEKDREANEKPRSDEPDVPSK